MSVAPELPPLVSAPFLALAGGWVLVRGLRHYARLVPAVPALRSGWRGTDLLAVGALVVGLILALGSTRLAGSVPGVLLATQLAFVAGGGLALALLRTRGVGPEALGLVRPRARAAYPAALLLYVPFVFLYFGLLVAWAHLARRLGLAEQQEVLALLLGLEGHELALACVLAVLVGPFLEELLFRGVLQGACSEFFGPREGWLVASTVFAAMHGLVGLPGLLALSLLLGWLRRQTGSLFVPFVVHAAHNGLTLALALLAGIR